MKKLIGAGFAVLCMTFGALAGQPDTDAYGCKVQPQPEVAAAEQPPIPNLSGVNIGDSLAPSQDDMNALNTGQDLRTMQLPTQDLASQLAAVVGDGSSTPLAAQGPQQDNPADEAGLLQLTLEQQRARALSGSGTTSQMGPNLKGPTYGDPCAGQQ